MNPAFKLTAAAVCCLSLLGFEGCSHAARGNLSSADAQKKEEGEKKPDAKASEPAEKAPRELVSRVLRDYKRSLESLSSSAALKQIDPQLFYDHPRFEENLTVFLRSLGELRLFFREVNVQVEEDRAVMVVDAEMKFARRDTGQKEERREQITFDFRRTKTGWKITEINPRAFFLP